VAARHSLTKEIVGGRLECVSEVLQEGRPAHGIAGRIVDKADEVQNFRLTVH
jgi:hypothetical protein